MLLLIHCGSMESCIFAHSWANVSIIITLSMWTLVSGQLVVLHTHPNKSVSLRTSPVLYGKLESSEILTCPEETRITVQKIESEGTSFLSQTNLSLDLWNRVVQRRLHLISSHHREGGNRKLNECWNKVTAIWLTKMWCVYRTSTSCRQWMTSSFCWMITLLRLRQCVALPSSNQ